MIGLGRMGGNMVQRLLAAGHRVVAYDTNAGAVSASESLGAQASGSLEDMVSRLAPPRPVWLMLPQGQPTQDTIDRLVPLLSPGDIILDGGNANYKETLSPGRCSGRAGHYAHGRGNQRRHLGAVRRLHPHGRRPYRGVPKVGADFPVPGARPRSRLQPRGAGGRRPFR